MANRNEQASGSGQADNTGGVGPADAQANIRINNPARNTIADAEDLLIFNNQAQEAALASQVNQNAAIVENNEISRIDYKLHILDSSNYIIWKHHTLNILEAKGLLKTVEEETCSDVQKERQTRALLTSALSPDNQMKVINCKTAYKIWKRLEAIYENKTSFEKENLLIKFHGFKIKSLANISQNVGELESIAAKLTLFGEIISDDTMVTTILRALPKSCKTFITVWKGTPKAERTVDNLLSRLMAEVEDEREEKAYLGSKDSRSRINDRRGENADVAYKSNGGRYRKNNRAKYNSGSNNNSSSSGRNNNRPKNTDECFHCRKRGHWKKDCISYKNSLDREGQNPKGNHRTGNSSAKMHALMASPTNSLSSWIIDGGASVHITYNRKWICNYEEFGTPVKINLGNQSYMEAYGKGTVEIDSLGYLYDVYYAPDASNNLISESSCAMKGIEIITKFDKKILLFNKEELLTSQLNNGLYTVNLDIKINQGLIEESVLLHGTLEEWHQRFAHVNRRKLTEMANNRAVMNMDIDEDNGNQNFQCVACALGKSKKASHKSRTTPKAKKVAYSLHFDTVGPISEESLGGSKYFLLCKDEYSGYRFIKFVRYKSDIESQVKLCINQAELETSNKVLQIVSDNGSEFINLSLQEFLKDKGIIHDMSVAYTPEQNGYIERDIRTIFEAGRTLLIDSKLPDSLWAEAMATAAYVLNRTSNSKSKKTPYELWSGYRPDASKLRTFGQDAVVLLQAHERKKLDPKGEIVKFVGYTNRTNTYRFYCPETDRILIRCDAKFLDKTLNNSSSETFSDITKGNSTSRISPEYDENIKIMDDIIINDGIDEENESFISAEGSSTKNEEQVKTKSQEEDEEQIKSKLHKEKQVKGEPQKEEEELTIEEELKKINEDMDNIYQNIPRELHYRGDRRIMGPPEILPNRLRPRNGKENANLTTLEASTDPNSYKEALKRSDKSLWLKAMQEEIDSLMENKVWTLVDRPKNENIITNRCVLRIKRKPSGEIERYRARLVARGYSQIEGIDYNETYAPVVNTISVRLLFAYAAVESLEIAQFDVKTAFLYGYLDETIYMEQPEGFKEGNNKVCRLERSLYGLKQAPRMWNKELTGFLKEMNLQISKNDECIFFRREPLLIIAIYVDDGIIFARSRNIIDEALETLKRRFKIHDVEPNTYLGFQISRKQMNEISLHQESYISKILEKFNMNNAKPVEAPIIASSIKRNSQEVSVLNQVPYREAIGSLMYASCITRIDITCAVGYASRQVSDPKEKDWEAVKRVFRYLTDKKNLSITYGEEYDYGMVAYCDADFAGDRKTSRSTTGLVVIYGGGPIHWRSQRQSLVTLSSTEAEVVSLCTAVKDVVWIRRLAIELGVINKVPTPIFCDNESAVRISTNLKSSHRTRHMSVQSTYPLEQIENKEVIVHHVKAENQLADMLTKPTTGPKFVRNRNLLMTTLMSLTLISMFFTQVCESIVFDRVSPVVWMDTKKYVDHGPITYVLQIQFANPCVHLMNLKHSRKKRQVMIGQPQPQPQYANPGINPNINPNINSNMNQNQNNIIDQEDAAYQQALKLAVEHCDAMYYENIAVHLDALAPHNKGQVTLSRQIRGIGDFTSGMFFSNIITTVIDHVWNSKSINEISDREDLVEKKLDKLQKEVNITEVMEKAIADSLKSISDIVTLNAKRLSNFVHKFPDLAFTTNLISAGIARKGNVLSRIRYAAKRKQIDLTAISELLNTDILDKIIDQSAQYKRIWSPEQNTLRIEFVGRIGDPTTQIYRVNPFRFWSIRTETPVLMEYIGERYLIYNSSNNCMEAIEEPLQMFITRECKTPNKNDKRLSQWQRVIQVENPYEQPANTSIKESWPFVYIYCYRLNITVDGEHTRCPPYVFKLNATTEWNTTDTYYSPKTYNYDGSWDVLPINHNIHSAHFTGEEHIIDENIALDKIFKLNNELTKFKKENIALELPIRGGGITHATALYISWWVTGGFFIIVIVILIYKHFSDINRHERVIKTVTDGIYGDGHYETTKSSTKRSNKSDTMTMTSPAQVNVTLNGAGMLQPQCSSHGMELTPVDTQILQQHNAHPPLPPKPVSIATTNIASQ